MKKLMVAVAAAATAFGLYADGGLWNQIGFEQFGADTVIDGTKDDTGTATGTLLWTTNKVAGSSQNIVTEYGTGEAYTYGTGDLGPIVSGGPGDKFLKIDSGETMYRTLKDRDDLSGTAIGTGVFFDTLVKMTIADKIDVPTLDADAKIAIWAGCDEENNGPTNLYVTAAYQANGLTAPVATNFVLDVGADFDFTAWHRITVRTIANINTDAAKVCGFIVYIDGALVASSDSDYADKIGKGLTLDSAVTPFYNAKQLFVSLSVDNANEVYGIGFQGSGAIDDLSITDSDKAPAFAKPANVFTINWTDGVTGFTLTPNAGDAIVKTGLTGSGFQAITLDPAITTFTVSDVTLADGYTEDAYTFNGKPIEGKVFTLAGATDQGAINASIKYFDVNGKQYANFDDALTDAFANGGTLALLRDFTAATGFGKEFTAVQPVTIDLAGKAMTFADCGECVFLIDSGSVTLIDTVGNGSITAAPAVDFAGIFYTESGVINIGLDDDSDKGATINGKLTTTGGVTIVKGNFDKTNNGADKFDYTIDGTKYEVVDTVKDGYWTVKANGADPVFTITIAETTNGTLETSVTNDVAARTEVTVTATPATGYSLDYIKTNDMVLAGNTFAMPADDVTVAAAFTANVYTVSYELGLDGAMNATDNIKSYTITTAEFELLPAGCDGYTFNNWTNAEGTVVAKIAGGATGNLTLYANFTKQGGEIPTDPEKDITDDTKPADIGLDPEGPFGEAKKAELVKLSKWANKAHVNASGINEGMTFDPDGNPKTDMADAYLLDCTTEDLTEAKAAFKFNAEDLAAAMAGTTNPETFAAKFYNGKIVIKAFTDVTCKTPATDELNAKFYKAFLVK